MRFSSSTGGDAQTRQQGPFTTLHWNLEPAPRQQDNGNAPGGVRGRRCSRLVLQFFRPLVLLVLSLTTSATSMAQTNCGCWNSVSSWQGTYSLTLTGTGPFALGTYQINSSSQGSFVMTNMSGTVMSGPLIGTGSVDVSGSTPTTCNGGPGVITCSVSGSGSLEGSANIHLVIDTTNCTYQIYIADLIPCTSTEVACGSTIFQMPFDGGASADLAAPTGSGGIGILPSFPLPAFGDPLTEASGTFTATTVAPGGCGESGSFTLTISWNITPEISSGPPPQFTMLPPGGPLGCNPTNIPGPADVLDNTTATAASGMVSVSAESVDVTNGCTVTRSFTLTATDDCSAQQATALVAYTWTSDTNPPVITSLPPGGSLGCNATNPPTDAKVQSQVVATDNCGTPSINVSHTDVTNECTVTRTLTITATDACGNVSQPGTVVYTWTVDTTPPTFTQLPPGGNLGNNPPTVPDDAAARAMTQASDNCGTPSISVTHMDSGTSPVTRTFTITATDSCGNSTPATVGYTWTGTVGGGGTNAPPRLDIARLGTNVVLFWSTNAIGYGLQSELNFVISNAWGNITNIPVMAGGTNYVTNPISGSAMFYRLAQ